MYHSLKSKQYSHSQIWLSLKFRGSSQRCTWGLLSSGMGRCGTGYEPDVSRQRNVLTFDRLYFSEEHGWSGRVNLDSKDIRRSRNVSIWSTVSSGLLFWTTELIKTVFKSQVPTSRKIQCVFKEEIFGFACRKSWICCDNHAKHIHYMGKMRRWRVLTLWRRNFFLILAHPVYKMWITQEPKKVALSNKRHSEEKKKTESVQHV